MLILSRKHGQSLVLNDGVIIHVLDIRGNSVRLGIQAPEDIVVMRAELMTSPAEVAQVAPLALSSVK